MAWASLKDTLDDRPRVLAGPILRKVTPESATVWLALRMAATVALTVHDEGQNLVMTGTRKTASIGINLHIVAVTANILPPRLGLQEGIVYQYDLAFDFDDGINTNLATATGNKVDLHYSPFGLPSFALPPKDLNLLRLIHGSCRMPHAEGKDTFPLLDNLIAETASNAFTRPHQLLLMGDQIYADDVADILSLLLADAGDALLGWSEKYMSTAPFQETPRWMIDLHPALRERFLEEAGFTSVHLRCHLMGLGEYLSMYLFVWSDVLWPSAPATLPTFEELAAAFSEKIHAMDEAIFRVGLPESRRSAVRAQTAALQHFRQTLPKVRRALANIPSYMIFDDHEVTDDWNMTRNVCRDLYGKPLSLRIVQNALVAYALCQHWGNAPEQFDSPGIVAPGLRLLSLLDAGTAATYDQHSRSIRTLVGLHDDTTLNAQPHKALFHDPFPFSLQYHFTVEGPGHQVIITDTRTWRSFPDGGNEGSEILPKEQFKHQILDTPPTGDRVLLVVLSTNAPSVEPIRTATREANITNWITHHPDVYDSWEAPSTSFDRLLKTLTDKLPLDSNGHRVGQVILLSGDVHVSFATRLIYRATNRFEDATPQPATAVMAQLVSSSFKKQSTDTLGFHREGYTYSPKVVKFLRVIRRHAPEGYVGWNVSSKQTVGHMQYRTDGVPTLKSPIELKSPKTLELWTPAVHVEELTWDLLLQVTPHYRYRIDYLLPKKQEQQLDAPPMPALPAGVTPAARKQAAEAFRIATVWYRIYNIRAQPKVVGVNNFGEITFEWSAGPNKKVNHTVRWGTVFMTTYTVSLDPNDPDYKDLKAKVEP